MSCRKNFDRQMSKSGCCNNSKDVDYSGDVLLVNKIMLLNKKISAFFFFWLKLCLSFYMYWNRNCFNIYKTCDD